ncbi:MAG: hypothetical protein QOC82_1910 [Frankiaceae bacterium]|jgi:hypothetical protein|nr:hypothetical protein [Frankiaceae bacterium]
MPGTTNDELPSAGFIARYLADAAKQELPARGVAIVLQSYVQRGLPTDRIRAAIALARDGVAESSYPLLEQYAEHLSSLTTGRSPSP